MQRLSFWWVSAEIMNMKTQAKNAITLKNKGGASGLIAIYFYLY